MLPCEKVEFVKIVKPSNALILFDQIAARRMEHYPELSFTKLENN
jgi:hypothetical protein